MIETPSSLAYGGRRFSAPLPGSYWDRVQRPLRNQHLESALALLDEAMWTSPARGRALIQEAMGAIRQSED
jgi:hypothetical protein